MIKKSTLAFALLFVLGSSPAWAQKAEITPFIGYQFGGKVALVNGDVKLKDAANFGAILDFTVGRAGRWNSATLDRTPSYSGGPSSRR